MSVQFKESVYLKKNMFNNARICKSGIAIIIFSYPFQTDYLTSDKMDIATNSKIPYTGHQKLGHASLKQFGGLTVTGIKSLYAKIHMLL